MTARYVFIGVSELFSLVLFLQVCFHPRWAYKQAGSAKWRWLLISFASFFVLLGIPAVIVWAIGTGRRVHRIDYAHVQDFRASRAADRSQRVAIEDAVRKEVQRQTW